MGEETTNDSPTEITGGDGAQLSNSISKTRKTTTLKYADHAARQHRIPRPRGENNKEKKLQRERNDIEIPGEGGESCGHII
jgi:hypothetical protein